MLNIFRSLFITIFLFFTANALANPEFGMPLSCNYRQNCFIQNYMAVQKDNQALDYHCTTQTYANHTGTDFRILDYVQMRAGIKVLAVAAGTVKATRDQEIDFLFIDFGKAFIKNKECGNGIVITHTDGYESQYCHLAKNSIVVKPGQPVNKGDTLGLIGMSGLTNFPHVHLTIRKDGIIIDPFTGLASSNNFCQIATINHNHLWDKITSDTLKYLTAAILNFHITEQLPDAAGAKQGRFREDKINRFSSKIILWADLIHVKQNDIVQFKISTLSGNIIFVNNNLIKQDYHQYFIDNGKKLDKFNLANGYYTAEVILIRDKNIIAKQSKNFAVE